MKDTYSYSVASGPVTSATVHGRRKRRDHAETFARKLSLRYPADAYQVWEHREYDGYLGRMGSAKCVVTYRAGVPS